MIHPFLIGDQWRRGTAGRTFESINPADGSVAAVVAESSQQDVDDAVAAAQAALADPTWANLYPHQRARLLRRLGDLVDANGEKLAQLQSRDNGKTIAESRAQVGWAGDVFRYYAGVCETFESAVIPSRGNYLLTSTYEPMGVVAAITPWNSPISLEAQKLAPALAAGNAVVLKSSEVTPMVGLEYGKLVLEAGFPPGVVNVVTGGVDVGRALVGHAGVDMVTFTGGVAGGRAVARAAAERLVPALLELGGKSPNIIFDDADIDHAVIGASYGIFSNAGQSCIAGSRIFVQDSIYDEFAQRLTAAVKRLTVGDPFDASTAVAPVSSFQHRDRILSMVGQALNEGTRALCGGARLEGGAYDRGAYVAPTVLELPSNQARIAQEEIFGPVACLLRFRDEDDLVQQANDTVFGLACGVWTENYRRATRIARRIKAGMVWVNTYKQTPVNMPFGGHKSSGIGRECGLEGLRPYLQQKSVFMNLAEEPLPWPPRGT
ncbi:MAG: aldehyde dehydrogenase family protein [Burkholderiales bacterium]|nr:aldehyde dehydrogenase family protein [Burkholderiales bacterium]ODU62395.1 MAG: aldehyde dehydrogenase [Lautropia sp. SCN 66-9]